MKYGGMSRVLGLGAILVACGGLARADSDQLLPGMGEVLARAGPSSAVRGPEDGPQVLRMVIPAYPRSAHAAALQGRVVVCFDVDETGKVVNPVIITSSADVFEPTTLAAVQRSTFLPARQGDIPVRSHLCRTYRYVLE